MKNIFYTALLTTALSLPAAYALAQTGSMSGSGTTSGATTGTTGTMDSTASGTMNNTTDTTTTGTTGSTDTTTGTLGTTDTTAGTGTVNSDTTTGTTTGAATDTTTGTTTTGATTDTTTGTTTNTATGTTSAGGSADMNTTVSVSSLNQMQVQQIQTALRDAGFPPGPVDGVWGPRTAASLQRFQQQRGLDRAQSVANTRASPALIHAETLQSLGIGLNEMQPAAGAGTTGIGTSTGLDGMDNTMNADDAIDNDRLESNEMDSGIDSME